jgi:hypothetical protein
LTKPVAAPATIQAPLNPVTLVLIVGLVSAIVGVIQAWMIYNMAMRTAMLNGTPNVPPGTWAAVVGGGAKAARNTLLLGLAVVGACHLIPLTGA